MEIVTKIVTCVDNSYSTKLTKGKQYHILNEVDNKIYIKNDIGEVKTYYRSRFK